MGNQMGPSRRGTLSLGAPLETTSRWLWLEINRGHWVCPEVEAGKRTGTGELAPGRWESPLRHEVLETLRQEEGG